MIPAGMMVELQLSVRDDHDANICANCILSIEAFFKYKAQCVQNDRLLRKKRVSFFAELGLAADSGDGIVGANDLSYQSTAAAAAPELSSKRRRLSRNGDGGELGNEEEEEEDDELSTDRKRHRTGGLPDDDDDDSSGSIKKPYNGDAHGEGAGKVENDGEEADLGPYQIKQEAIDPDRDGEEENRNQQQQHLEDEDDDEEEYFNPNQFLAQETQIDEEDEIGEDADNDDGGSTDFKVVKARFNSYNIIFDDNRFLRRNKSVSGLPKWYWACSVTGCPDGVRVYRCTSIVGGEEQASGEAGRPCTDTVFLHSNGCIAKVCKEENVDYGMEFPVDGGTADRYRTAGGSVAEGGEEDKRRRPQKIIVYEGYRYKYCHARPEGSFYWRCVLRHDKDCLASIQTKRNLEFLNVNDQPHNHEPPDPSEPHENAMLCEIRLPAKGEATEGSTDFKLVKSGQKREFLIYKGYRYYFQYESKNGRRSYRCTMFKNCPAGAFLLPNSTIQEAKNFIHTHPPVEDMDKYITKDSLITSPIKLPEGGTEGGKRGVESGGHGDTAAIEPLSKDPEVARRNGYRIIKNYKNKVIKIYLGWRYFEDYKKKSGGQVWRCSSHRLCRGSVHLFPDGSINFAKLVDRNHSPPKKIISHYRSMGAKPGSIQTVRNRNEQQQPPERGYNRYTTVKGLLRTCRKVTPSGSPSLCTSASIVSAKMSSRSRNASPMASRSSWKCSVITIGTFVGRKMSTATFSRAHSINESSSAQLKNSVRLPGSACTMASFTFDKLRRVREWLVSWPVYRL
uniref:FLYWCH-type domain-containing protein n=1 Tax=Anopheles coluzzii TaxID=1518534 RepID=A0A8W7PL98_ANOCL